MAGKDLGKVRFFAQDMPGHVPPGPTGSIPGSLGPLGSHVEMEGTGGDMIARLLRGVLLFADEESAVRFVTERPEGDAVTLTGTYFCRDRGIYFSGTKAEETSLLGRTEKIDEMKRSAAALEREVSELSDRCERDRTDRRQLLESAERIEQRTLAISKELYEKGEVLKETERRYFSSKEKCALQLDALDELETSRAEILSKLEES